MNQSLSSQQSPGFLFIAVSMITCLILLINVSFKIILLGGLVFAINSLICPLIAALFLFALRNCTFKEQRHLLNICLMTLYMFCIGVYVLVNLPAAEYMHDNPAYQVIFEEIPKKFFATTIAFALSFYLPHLLFCTKTDRVLSTPKQCVLLALLGGVSFFCLDFYLLFSAPHAHSFKQIFIDSFMISSLLLLIIGVVYLTFLLNDKQYKGKALIEATEVTLFPIYQYLICFAVTVILVCLACEYRIIAINKDLVLSASCIFFPITIIISSIVGELWGYQANLKLALALLAAQFIFDMLLMGSVALPSPPFFNLNPFYHYIMPRRLSAASLSLFVTFLGNAMLLHYLKYSKWKINRSLRILIANISVNSLLCLVDYSLLYGGIYPYEQIINLAVSVWQYKLLTALISLPVILWMCKILEKNYSLVVQAERN
ncbi:TPA: VUT family protein [Legionella pneumophila]|uniref:VUT family protein n=1 Tax=Legionella pneumophila TaxID=446 RepID=UPI0007891924|nr:VUT family protein [Legionella pneumophila]MDW8878686.1 VUT family protein [Legionella pneumophila subsp. fraseri]MDW8963000.1 VUT family protein [Legionella pneumophila subsp. fraseri]MDW9035410.1 VUT family protein [Legionella pneumophila subsp. fraseri]MDW9038471.1 VUT family protein [Legionella pneumophila subsp. fraseri]MDW9041532.1 VUT family protein [Legionella pneumophila subsp. fraseri]